MLSFCHENLNSNKILGETDSYLTASIMKTPKLISMQNSFEKIIMKQFFQHLYLLIIFIFEFSELTQLYQCLYVHVEYMIRHARKDIDKVVLAH